MFPARAFWARARSSTLDQITEKGPIIAGLARCVPKDIDAAGAAVKPDAQSIMYDIAEPMPSRESLNQICAGFVKSPFDAR